MYVGDSASLSFLQSIRRIVALAIGDCEFTTDPKRHTILETAPSGPMISSLEPLVLDWESVRQLTRQYILCTAGLIDLFDTETFFSEIESWVNNPSRDQDQRSCIYYLVMAIGAQAAFGACQQDMAEQYYSRGRLQAFYNFTEAPSLMTVQAYSLITVYLLGACRRNGAFMNFGIASRATFALGMHVHSTKSLFEGRESRERQSTWRSVRMLDVFFSASLGRPPATCDLLVSADSELSTADDTSEFSRKVLALTSIYDRIVIEVYMKKAMSTSLAKSISRQLDSWAQNMPDSLNIQTLPDFDEDRLVEILAATHIISAYHWAIILLTRPFLTSQILQDMTRKVNKSAQQDQSEEGVAIKKFADTCVDSSLTSLKIVVSLLNYQSLPKRLPFLINAVANIALVLGAAVFADQDKNFPLQEGLEQSLKILRHFLPHDPHASRYAQIITYLSEAVREYVRQRDQQPEKERREDVQPQQIVSHAKHDQKSCKQTPSAGPTPAYNETAEQGLQATDIIGNYNPSTPASFYQRPQDGMSDFLAFANSGGVFPDTIQPPSSVFGEGTFAFPDDTYLFMDQEPSIFGFWTG